MSEKLKAAVGEILDLAAERAWESDYDREALMAQFMADDRVRVLVCALSLPSSQESEPDEVERIARQAFRSGWWRRGKESALGVSVERRNELEDVDIPAIVGRLATHPEPPPCKRQTAEVRMNDDDKAYWNDAAGLIRKHLWKRKTPPPSPDGKPWHMGRECSVYKALLKCGWRAEELNGAISVLNTVEPYDGPRRLTVFYGTRVDPDNPERIVWTGTATMERCVGYWRNSVQFNRRKGPKMGGKVEISIQVTP